MTIENNSFCVIFSHSRRWIEWEEKRWGGRGERGTWIKNTDNEREKDRREKQKQKQKINKKTEEKKESKEKRKETCQEEAN